MKRWQNHFFRSWDQPAKPDFLESQVGTIDKSSAKERIYLAPFLNNMIISWLKIQNWKEWGWQDNARKYSMLGNLGAWLQIQANKI